MFPALIKDCLHIYRLQFVAILGPRIRGVRADQVIHRIGLCSSKYLHSHLHLQHKCHLISWETIGTPKTSILLQTLLFTLYKTSILRMQTLYQFI